MREREREREKEREGEREREREREKERGREGERGARMNNLFKKICVCILNCNKIDSEIDRYR